MVSRPQFVRKIVELGFCFPYIKNGYNIKQGKDQGGLPITRIETLSDNRFNRDKVGYADIYSTQGIENRILQDGDILMSHINSLSYLGRAVMYQALPGETFIHGMNLLRLKANRDVVDPAYAELYFQTPCFKRQILKIAKKAVNQASFSVRDLKELDFPLISLDDQHFVAERLHSITEQIARLKVVLTQLDTLIKSRFIEIFGDPCELESHADKVRIDSICEIRIGPFGSSLHKEDYVSQGHPLVNPSHIVNGEIIPDESLTISEEKYMSLKAYHLYPGDIVLGRRGEIGRCAVVKDYGLICGTGSMILRPVRDIRSDYLQRVISFPTFKQSLARNAVGVTMKNLNAKTVGSTEVCLPAIERQDAFISFVQQVDKSKSIAQRQIEKLQMLYDSLAQEYFGD